MEQFGDIPDRRMTIESEERTLESRRLMKQLEAQAWDNVPDTRDDGPPEGYLSRKRPISETMRIELSSADMPIPEMLGDGRQSILGYGDIHEVMWNSTLSNTLTSDDNLRD